MKTKLITLPSGKTLELREPTALDMYRMCGSLPDLRSKARGSAEQAAEIAASVADSMNASEGFKLGIRMICQLSVKPRIWADLENDPPRPAPDGYEEWDLDMDDFTAACNALNLGDKEDAESIAPLSETCQPS